MQKAQIHNRKIYSHDKNPYIIFNGERLYFVSNDFFSFKKRDFKVIELVEVVGKAHSIYFTTTKIIKNPLEFNTLYNRFLKDGELLISDEITLREYHEIGKFEPTITTYIDKEEWISVISRGINNPSEDEQNFFYSSHKGSKRSTLLEALYAFSGLIVK